MTHREAIASVLASGCESTECEGLLFWIGCCPMRGASPLHIHKCQVCGVKVHTLDGKVMQVCGADHPTPAGESLR